ncbi:hypothetical protein [Rouxiella silvae]|uniref:hypothetical protein n=1 Tax=Rouxiella silvae TaxID=1646373 RepID=UPI0039F0244A
MYDSNPLTAEEILDQCRALSQAGIEVTDAADKEILGFILAEKLEHLDKYLKTHSHNE